MNEAWSEWPAPAKLNLFLHVLGRRADGYHDLETVFQLLDLSDTIRIRVRADGAVVRAADLPGIAAEADLTLRAARLLQTVSGTRLGAELRLEKRIPIGGGLGGGSSDAATVLVALNRLWRTGLDIDALATLGRELGADVAVFVRGDSAYALGVGDQLTPVPLAPAWYVLLDPHVQVSTTELFLAPDLTRATPQTTISRFFAGAATRNDFEPVVRARCPGVAAALDWMGAHAPARLTGTGGCVFAAFAQAQDARDVAERCPAAYTAYVARGVQRSPLHVLSEATIA